MKNKIIKIVLLLATVFSIKTSHAQGGYTPDTAKLSDSNFAVCGLTAQWLNSINTHTPTVYLSPTDPTDPSWAANGAVFTCGAFAVYYDDVLNHTGYGFDDGTWGATRRATYCAVLTYIQSVFDFSNITGGDHVNIHVLLSWTVPPGPNNPPPCPQMGALAVAGPVYVANSCNPTYPASGTYAGGVFDHVTTGTADDTHQFDGVVTVNFTGQYGNPNSCTLTTNFTWQNDGTLDVGHCNYDLYSVLLHETTHAMGWLSDIGLDVNNHPVIANGGVLTLFDYNYLWEAAGNGLLNYQYPIPTFNKLVVGPFNAPTITTNTVVTTQAVQGNIWLNNTIQFGGSGSANLNQPVYSGVIPQSKAYVGNDVKSSYFSHMDLGIYSWTDRTSGSPGYQPLYVMGPFAFPGEEKRTYTLPEIRALLGMVNTCNSTQYQLNPSFSASLVANHPPVYLEQNDNSPVNPISPSEVYPDYIYQSPTLGTPGQVVDYTYVNDPTLPTPLTYTTSTTFDPNLVDPDGNAMSVVPSTLYNIRGCGTSGNDHNALSLSVGNTVISYKPRADFLGLAQFGFYPTDGQEQGGFVVKTVNVTPGPNWQNSANCFTPTGPQYGPELVLNGDFENGSETRTTPSNEFDANSNIVDGWKEGDYYAGDIQSDSHPIDWSGFTGVQGGDIVQNSMKDCSTGTYTGTFGSDLTASPDVKFSTPVPDPACTSVPNDRFHWMWSTYNYLMLNNSAPQNTSVPPGQHCTYYTLTFDVNFAYLLAHTSVSSYTIKAGITNKVSYGYANSYDCSTTVTVTPTSSWQKVTTGFWYCGSGYPSNPSFLNFEVGNGLYEHIFLDNVSLVTNNTPPAMTVTATATPTVVCSGSPVTLSATVTNPGCSQTYTWQPGSLTGQSVTVNPASTTTYTVTATDACGPVATNTVTVTVNPLPVITMSSTNVECSSGSATANVTGSSPFTYLWAPGSQTTPTITGLTAGTYSVTVTDANGCSSTADVTITNASAVTASISGSTNVSCNGGSNGSATVTAGSGTGPYSYSWSPAGGTGSTANGLTAGSYTVTVTDANGCTATAGITITQPPVLTATITGSTPQTCSPVATGTATVTAGGGTPGYSYSWSPYGGSNATATALAPGTYTVTVTDANGCTATASVTITQAASPTVTISPVVNVSCYGGNNGSATANPSGGMAPYTYSWNPGLQTNQTATGLTAGSYTVRVTDANGCQGTASVTITQPAQLVASISNEFGPCSGTPATLDGYATGGTPAYSYSWAPSGGTNSVATGLAAGVYTLTVTDANGCTATATYTVTAVLSVTTTVTNVACHGASTGTATANPLGGLTPYTYSWNPTGQTTKTATGLSAGTYTVTVTDANGCTATATATVTQPTALTANTTVLNNEPCYSDSTGKASVSAGGGTGPYTYAWSPSGGTGSTTTSNLTAGTYTVTVTDHNGCTVTATATITQPALLTVTISTLNICNGVTSGHPGTATAIVSGGTSPYTYLWSTGATTSGISGLAAGTYTVTVHDANGCYASASITFHNNTLAASASLIKKSCLSVATGQAKVTASGGGTPYTYVWSPSGGTNATTTSNLGAGTYTVTVRDSYGCVVTASVTVGTDSLAVTIGTTPYCAGHYFGTATAIVTPGVAPYSYTWSNGAHTSSIAGLTPGTYSVTVTDANGCSATASAMVFGILCHAPSHKTGDTKNDSALLYKPANVYPNPASSMVNVETELFSGQVENICIYNSLGQQIRCVEMSTNITTISISDLPTGLYYYRIIDTEGDLIQSDKLMIAR